MSLRFDEEAAEEFYRAVEYYEAQSRRARKGTHRGPFVVVYRLVEGAPVVEAFAYQRQRPGYSTDRL